MQFGCTRDGNDPGLLRQQPRECDLSGRGFLPCRNPPQHLDQRLVGFPRLRREAREGIAEVGLIELSALVDLASQEPSAEWAIRDEADTKFLESRQQFLFGLSKPERVFVLHCRHRLDCVCAADSLHSCFRESEMLHLSCLDQVLDRSRYVFDWNVGIDAVLVKKIDNIGPKALERGLGDLLDVLGPAVHSTRPGVRSDLEAELGGDYHFSAKWR